MNIEIIIYVGSLLIASAVSFSLAYYAWTRPRRPVTMAYAVMALLQGVWTVCYALDQLSRTLAQKLLVDGLEWLFAYLFEFALLWFALAYTRRRLRRPRLTWSLIAAPALIIVVIVFSNDLQHLIYQSPSIVAAGPFLRLRVEYTPLTFAGYAYGYLIVVAVLWLLIRYHGDTSASFRTQTAIICIGVLVPAAMSIVALILDTDTTSPVSFFLLGITYAVGTVLIAVGVFRFRLFVVVPIARKFVIDTMSDAVIVVDPQSLVVDFNYAARAFADPVLPELVGRSLSQAFPRWLEAFKGLLSPGDLDSRFVSEESGHRRIFDLKIRSIDDERGKTVGRLAVVRDVSEQVRLEELKVSEETLKVALQKERELSALKSQMMIRIAHEFRTPLAIISLDGQTLEKYYDRITDEGRREKIGEMRRQIRHLTEILDDITTIVGVEYAETKASLSVFDVAELCRECVKSLGVGRNISVSMASPERLVSADRNGVGAIITDLLSNAIKYSPDGTTVQLEQWFDGDDLLLRVTDEGIGIADDDLKRIFEPFFRGQNTEDIGGLGLGLSIVRDYVNAHHGTISVESRVGQGTRFTVRLPNVALTGETGPPRAVIDNSDADVAPSINPVLP